MISKTPDISVLIVAYNSGGCIVRCIQAIREASQDADVEILLVDNGEDGSGELITFEFPDVAVMPSEGNVGFARANNRLAKHARGKRLLLLNPDAFLKPDAIGALLQATRNYPDAGAWGGVTVTPEGKPDFGNAIPLPSFTEFLTVAIGRPRSGRSIPAAITQDQEAEILSGGFLMIDRDVWSMIDGFDESFFLYGEDVDLSVRLKRAGYTLHRIAAARAIHQIAHGNFQSSQRRLYQAAGMMEFLRKHWSAPARVLAACLIWIGAFNRFAIGSIWGRNGSPLEATGKGYRLVALRPEMWLSGYHTERGLKAKLDRGEIAAKGS